MKIITQDWDGLIPGLLAGRIDLFLADSVVASESFLKKPEGKDYSFVGPDLTDSRWFGEGVGIAWRKEDTGLLKKLNEAIEKIRADGLIRKSRINILRAKGPFMDRHELRPATQCLTLPFYRSKECFRPRTQLPIQYINWTYYFPPTLFV